MTALVMVVAPVAGRIADKVGSRWLVTAGMLLLVVQLLLFARLDETADFWDLLPAFVVGGIGMASAMPAASAAAMKAVPVEKVGVGSAVLNAHRQVGGSLGVALMGAIVASRAVAEPSIPAFLDGLHLALEVAAAIAFVGALVAASLLRGRDGGVASTVGRPAEAG
jgi:MFS family permease